MRIMAETTAIAWTDATWNPTVGCSVISPGCTNCYAMRLAGRLEKMGSPIYGGHTMMTRAGAVWNGKVGGSNWGQIIKPLSWRRPRRIFVNSMSDLFHENMPEEIIDTVFAVMALCPQHQFQVLTKRAGRMQDYMASAANRIWDRVSETPDDWRVPRADGDPMLPALAAHGATWGGERPWPLRNVWLGVSVEDQERADERIPLLLATPAEVHFLSCEPLLGPIDFRKVPGFNRVNLSLHGWWVICGGESGPHHRPLNLDHARALRDQCCGAGVPFFFKQVGGQRHTSGGDLLDGVQQKEFPG